MQQKAPKTFETVAAAVDFPLLPTATMWAFSSNLCVQSRRAMTRRETDCNLSPHLHTKDEMKMLSQLFCLVQKMKKSLRQRASESDCVERSRNPILWINDKKSSSYSSRLPFLRNWMRWDEMRWGEVRWGWVSTRRIATGFDACVITFTSRKHRVGL